MQVDVLSFGRRRTFELVNCVGPSCLVDWIEPAQKGPPPYRPKAMPILKYNIIACHSIVFRALHRDHRLSRVELNDGKRASKSKRARE